jgi:DNA-binding HxlR family transcriptional regulator
MDDNCTIYKTMDFIGKRWTLLILLELYKGKPIKRYSELKENLGEITPKILSTRLKELESHGMIKKEIDASKFPIKCEYSLTERGLDFIRIIKDMKRWALRWNVKNKVCEKSNCKNCEF